MNTCNNDVERKVLRRIAPATVAAHVTMLPEPGRQLVRDKFWNMPDSSDRAIACYRGVTVENLRIEIDNALHLLRAQILAAHR